MTWDFPAIETIETISGDNYGRNTGPLLRVKTIEKVKGKNSRVYIILCICLQKQSASYKIHRAGTEMSGRQCNACEINAMHVKGENGELGCQVCIEWRKKLMGENNQFETPDK